jgi:MSHA biogenesis protein MshJ
VKALAPIEAGAARFNHLTVRERVLIVAAVLAAIVTLWDMLLMGPLETKRKVRLADLSTLQSSMAATSQAVEAARANDPITVALGQIKAAQRALAVVNSELDSTSAGLLPPERMAEVIHDMLHQRPNIGLISLRSEPVASLLQQPADDAGPYIHPVEVVLEGRYLDILQYLRALEALHWRLYWKTLELDSAHYPLDRVRIELSTLSLDRTWLGL